MEYRIKLASPNPDMAAINAVLLEVDPAAIVDQDPADGTLRVTAWASAGELGAALTQAGYTVNDVELQPSVCCGDCSG